MNEVTQYNKAIVAALVTIIGWVAYEWGGVDIPDAVKGAFTTVLVFLVPNTDSEE